MQIIPKNQLSEFRGGDNDCVFQAISFLTDKSIEEISLVWGNHAASISGWANVSGGAEYCAFQAINSGLSMEATIWLTQYYGLSQGITPSGAIDYSVSGGTCIAILSVGGTGSGNAHAIDLTGNAPNGDYYYYDPQTGDMGTIARNDPRLITTFGY